MSRRIEPVMEGDFRFQLARSHIDELHHAARRERLAEAARIPAVRSRPGGPATPLVSLALGFVRRLGRPRPA
ncbi:MAG TPA: hypothetical protein VFO50_01275 [Candidatus Limnocylindrales bacterium]|nr:hypothetical protein [Candidatus Limnocylindrales bacterium]HEU4919320.1 hypothetical protein [Candidatus Limnocylindrales bacterium]